MIDGTLHEGNGYSLRVTYAGGDFLREISSYQNPVLNLHRDGDKGHSSRPAVFGSFIISGSRAGRKLKQENPAVKRG